MVTPSWKSEYETGIAEIDEQHRHYIFLLGKLSKVIQNKRPIEEIAKSIDEIFGHLATHFSTEEEYFDKYHYKDSDKHKEEHKKLIVSALDFKYRFGNEGLKMVPSLIDFLENWILHHITFFDKKYSDSLPGSSESDGH